MNRRNIVAVFIVTFLLIVGLFPQTAHALDSSVEYRGQTDGLIFTPDTDLFQNFKGMMPGDIENQVIDLKNTSDVPLKLYVKIEFPDNSQMDLLNLFSMQIMKDTEVLVEDLVGNITFFSKDNLLTEIPAGGSAKLNVKLTLPIEAGDELQGADLRINWVFTAEEHPIPSPSPSPTITTTTEEKVTTKSAAKTTKPKTVPSTGELSYATPFAFMLICTAGALMVKKIKQQK